MKLRYANKLDPAHKYTMEEIKQMRLDPAFKDFDIFKRYDDETIFRLLNEVASNNYNFKSDKNSARV